MCSSGFGQVSASRLLKGDDDFRIPQHEEYLDQVTICNLLMKDLLQQNMSSVN
jgi:hypothetical protein